MPHKTAHDYLELRATQLREEAEALSHGDAREALLCRARKVKAASLVVERWFPPRDV
jgi:hypothetical protein